MKIEIQHKASEWKVGESMVYSCEPGSEVLGKLAHEVARSLATSDPSIIVVNVSLEVTATRRVTPLEPITAHDAARRAAGLEVER